MSHRVLLCFFPPENRLFENISNRRTVKTEILSKNTNVVGSLGLARYNDSVRYITWWQLADKGFSARTHTFRVKTTQPPQTAVVITTLRGRNIDRAFKNRSFFFFSPRLIIDRTHYQCACVFCSSCTECVRVRPLLRVCAATPKRYNALSSRCRLTISG